MKYVLKKDRCRIHPIESYKSSVKRFARDCNYLTYKFGSLSNLVYCEDGYFYILNDTEYKEVAIE